MTRIIHLLMLFLLKAFFYLPNRAKGCRCYRFVQKMFHYTYLRYFGVETGFGDVTLVGLPLIRRYKGSRIIIGRNVTVVSHSAGNVVGINHRAILATLAEGATIDIGDRCGISGSSICAVRGVKIGNNSGLGANASVYDTDFHAMDAMKNKKKGILDAAARPVEIGENVWVAANVIILKGVKVGHGAVIGAGSIVTQEVPRNAVVAGNPAKVVRLLAQEPEKQSSP
jgi:acetyltransferase-like isoleucine patch superfamily enzyme